MIYLEYLLRKYHLQHKDLAEELGIRKQNINMWLKGKQNISKKYLPVLSKKFHVSYQCLEKDVEEVFAEDVINTINDVFFGKSKENIKFRVDNGSNGCAREVMKIIQNKYINKPNDNICKQGHWDYIAWYDVYSCNLCKFDSEAPLEQCPNCHAEMRVRNG